MITICFTHFRSLTLANLRAALYSVSRQDLTLVNELIIFDNDTPDTIDDIRREAEQLNFPTPIRVISFKHGESGKTHSWSTNQVVGRAQTPWVFFTRSDYLLDFDILQRFKAIIAQHSEEWNGFLTGHVYHLAADINYVDQMNWHASLSVLRALPGAEGDYTHIDSGVWMCRTDSFHKAGGLDERLTGWGHAQTEFQYRLHHSGVEFVRIPEVLFYHPSHSGERNLAAAHQQLADTGINLKELWSRYEGASPY